MLGIDEAPTSPHPPEQPPSPSHKQQGHTDSLLFPRRAREQRNRVFRAMERVGLALAVVVVAILFPAFGAVMAFLGAFSAFMLCVIGPICAKAALAHKLEAVDAVLLVIATVMATAGTWVAFKTGAGA
jgi:vesicular inhibitory amino acid transporter